MDADITQMFDLSRLSPEQRKQVEEELKKMTPEQIQELIKRQCIFCKIAKKEVESYVVFESDKIMAVLDMRPANPGHVLIFPKDHYLILHQVPEDILSQMFVLSKYISAIVFELVNAQGINIIVSSGAAAGQGLPHAIVHVIPRFPEDGMPQSFWKPKEVKEEVMQKMQKALGESLKSIKLQAPAKAIVEEEAPKEKKEKIEKVKLPKVKPRRP